MTWPTPLAPLDHSVRQARSVEEVAHRPWPLPDTPWLQGQTWERLLFAHWRVSHESLRPHVPAVLELERYDGSAWIGLTPFRVSALRLRGLPPLPLLSSFYELNCRTYVRHGDRPGIWFFSLVASSLANVVAARLTFRLPYVSGRFARRDGGLSVRAPNGSFTARYRPAGPVGPAAPGSLEEFLAERYCLYAGDGTVRSDIHHRPWPLQRAEAELRFSRLSPVPLEGEPLLHYAERQDTVVWRPERIVV